MYSENIPVIFGIDRIACVDGALVLGLERRAARNQVGKEVIAFLVRS